MGTASYMSPEQAEGKPVDKRTDVWSFGVLLYEMLTGKRLFDGKSDAHVLVHVMEQEPDWTKLPPLPNGVQALIERCLQKDPAQRLRDIGDVRIQLQASLTHPIQTRDASVRRTATARRWLWPAVGAAAIVVVAGIVAVLAWPRRAPVVAADAVRFDIARSGGESSPFIAISPDGRRLAFSGPEPRRHSQLWVRTLATQEARPLDGATQVDRPAVLVRRQPLHRLFHPRQAEKGRRRRRTRPTSRRRADGDPGRILRPATTRSYSRRAARASWRCHPRAARRRG